MSRRVATVGYEAATLGALLDHYVIVVVARILSIGDPGLLLKPVLGFSLSLSLDLLHLLLLIDVVLRAGALVLLGLLFLQVLLLLLLLSDLGSVLHDFNQLLCMLVA